MNRQNKELKIRLAKIRNELQEIVEKLYTYFQSGTPGGFRTPGWSFLRDQSAPQWYMYRKCRPELIIRKRQ